MRITNHSTRGVTVMEAEGEKKPLAAWSSLHTGARKVALHIHYLPCKIEIAEEPEEVTADGQ